METSIGKNRRLFQRTGPLDPIQARNDGIPLHIQWRKPRQKVFWREGAEWTRRPWKYIAAVLSAGDDLRVSPSGLAPHT
jgi:hypothetical protein